MDHLLYLLLAILATWRLTYDFVILDGPLGMYKAVRKCVKSKEDQWPEWIVTGIDCGYCISWWVGFGIAFLLPSTGWQEYLLQAIAISGAVTLLARYLKAMYSADLFE